MYARRQVNKSSQALTHKFAIPFDNCSQKIQCLDGVQDYDKSSFPISLQIEFN